MMKILLPVLLFVLSPLIDCRDLHQETNCNDLSPYLKQNSTISTSLPYCICIDYKDIFRYSAFLKVKLNITKLTLVSLCYDSEFIGFKEYDKWSSIRQGLESERDLKCIDKCLTTNRLLPSPQDCLIVPVKENDTLFHYYADIFNLNKIQKQVLKTHLTVNEIVITLTDEQNQPLKNQNYLVEEKVLCSLNGFPDYIAKKSLRIIQNCGDGLISETVCDSDTCSHQLSGRFGALSCEVKCLLSVDRRKRLEIPEWLDAATVKSNIFVINKQPQVSIREFSSREEDRYLECKFPTNGMSRPFRSNITVQQWCNGELKSQETCENVDLCRISIHKHCKTETVTFICKESLSQMNQRGEFFNERSFYWFMKKQNVFLFIVLFIFTIVGGFMLYKFGVKTRRDHYKDKLLDGKQQ